ncbi:MAG: hypothetical protein ACTTJC_07665 [Campylobacter sp.]
MTKFYKFALLVAIATIISGCFKMPTPEEQIAQSQYPALTKAFYDAKIGMDSVRPNRIVIDRYMMDYFGAAAPSIQYAVNEYISRYDSSKDKIAKTFIANAKANGHTVKMYKKNVNAEISSVLPSVWGANNYPNKANLDVAFIEFDENGQMIAILSRLHYYSDSLGAAMDHLVSMVSFGNLASLVESQVGNYALENGLIREIK